jgi:hypothetical protein
MMPPLPWAYIVEIYTYSYNLAKPAKARFLVAGSALPLTLSPDLFSKMRFSSVVLPEPRNPDSRVTGRRVSCISLMASISLILVVLFDLVLALLLAEDELRLGFVGVALVAVGLADLAAGLPAEAHYDTTAAGREQQQQQQQQHSMSHAWALLLPW